MTRARSLSRLLVVAIVPVVLGAPPPPRSGPAAFDEGVISGLGARNVGSAAMSGRIAAVAARNTDDGKVEVFVGAASGGVWKSYDGGTTFKPVFDKEAVQSIGAIALDPGSPRTVWVGTGESWTRNSVSIGNGIYKSTDDGETWKNMGLPESERIAKIVVHPKDGDVVYACVPGKLWSDSPDRGLYRTTDGGRSWTLILKGKNLSTGCSSLTMDPVNPDVMLAGLWDFRRQGWTFRSGGDGPDAASGSGLYRTTDGGKSWTELTADTVKGLPKKPWGRVEVEIAPSDGKRVYAFIESIDSALYVSDDGAASWEQRDKSQMMVWRPFYFANLVVDPTNADRVFKMNAGPIVSEDGGKTFGGTGGGSHGDWHDLWIDPKNPKHAIGGDDGGLWISYDGGNRWWKCDNLPVSQFYHVAVDDRDPYEVYGGLQDNSSWIGTSSYPGGITNAQWENVYGGDGFWTVPDPSDPDIVYAESQGGYIGCFDRKTRVARDIQPKAGYEEKLRFNWNAPIHCSRANPGTVYLGAQFLFRSRDRGQSWERISPDLTTNDAEQQKQEESGGITVDNSSAEMHTTIYAISESPKNGKLVWVGTDDGKVQVTRDGGAAWQDVTPKVTGMAAGSWVSSVAASPHDEGTAFVTIDRHSYGDMAPCALRTTDSGKSWTRIAGPDQGIRGYAHVIVQDTKKAGLLFLGTELGLWVSIDGGTRWAEFKGSDFPSVAVRDIAIQAREDDLVIGTHGRGIWIVDDIAPLRALSGELLQEEAAFLPSRPTQQRMGGIGSWVLGDNQFVGASAPGGAVITYYQRTRHLFGNLKLEIVDPDGKVIDTIPASKRRGINRVTWTMHVPPPRVPRAAQVAFGASQGPRVLPGTYTVRLTKAGKVYESKLVIGLDRRATYTLEDRKAELDAAMKVCALFEDMTDVVDRLNAIRDAAGQIGGGLPDGDALRVALASLASRADEIRKKVVATKEGGAITGEERIREHAEILYGQITGYEGRPGDYMIARIDALRRELGDVQGELDALLKEQLPGLNERLKAKGLPAIEGP
ncbi:MAG: sialidase [Acidobacteriota bacterium]